MDVASNMPAHPTTNYQFTLPMEVRDYECDLQGIVNNAVYLHYLEHARHQFLKRHGFSFAALTKAGVHLVVVRTEIDYKAPLRSGDAFRIGLTLERISAARFGFTQDIHRLPDKKLVLTSTFICAAMDAAGKPILPQAIESLFGAAPQPVEPSEHARSAFPGTPRGGDIPSEGPMAKGRGPSRGTQAS